MLNVNNVKYLHLGHAQIYHVLVLLSKFCTFSD